MSAHPTLSRFTPSLMSAELLERLFVGRERLLEAIMVRIEGAAAGSGRNHTLLVGPRGAGKTHLVALAHHRAARLRDSGAQLHLSWLPEDPWTIASYRHLLLAIVDGAGLKHSRQAKSHELEDLIDDAARTWGPLVVFVENLDQILDSLGDEGQQRLRHLLQDTRSVLFVATTTRLHRNLSDQSRPFYGFFTTSRLEPFDVDDAASMLRAIASETDQQDLVAYLETEEANSRLRTIAHLAGGQPRMWATLASSLSIRGLDELVDLLLTRFDDLTPYYQEQLARLSTRQRLVVAELATTDHPLNVKELADRLDVDQRSLAKTMSELVERGWATTVTSPLLGALVDRRRSYYELAEPMARLAFQIKESRGEPLRLVVDFLKNWFDPGQLRQTEITMMERSYLELAASAQLTDPVLAVTRQLHQLPSTRAPAVELLDEVDRALRDVQEGRPDAFLGMPTPIRAAVEALSEHEPLLSTRSTIHHLAMAEFAHVRHPAMTAWVDRAAVLAMVDEAWRLMFVQWLGRAWRFDEALAGLAASAEDLSVIAARADVAFSAWEAGSFALASELLESVLSDRERLLGPDDLSTLTARGNLAVIYDAMGRSDAALALKEAVLADHERLLGHEERITLRSRSNLAVTYDRVGRHDDALALKEPTVQDCERLLGSDHPDTLIARANLAVTYNELGRHSDALALEEAVLADLERLLGVAHPDTLLARSNLALTYYALGRNDESRALLETVVADTEHVLGAEHPTTANRLRYLRLVAGSSD